MEGFWFVMSFVLGWIICYLIHKISTPKAKASLYVSYEKDSDDPYDMHLALESKEALQDNKIIVKIIKVREKD